jgi:hypothetical protein
MPCQLLNLRVDISSLISNANVQLAEPARVLKDWVIAQGNTEKIHNAKSLVEG